MTATFDFSGKNVFVAGGTSGINLGIAQAFAAAGASVAVLSRSQEKVDAAVELLSRSAPRAVGFSADVREYEAVETAMKSAHASLGMLDIVISGAAGNFPAPALGMSPNAFKAVVGIDLLGTYHVLRAAYPFLRRPGASLINISAPQAFNPMPLQMHVCAAKAGVDMITRVGALEWGPEGVRVNSVVPGPIEGTEGMARLAPTPEAEAMVSRSVPLRRMGAISEVADCCLWLCSPQAAYVNGAVIPVDGGSSLMGGRDLSRGFSKDS
jgi:NAD(P)-dependent dehydrogenase (short-subunit alcohol dehydrogenase family)